MKTMFIEWPDFGIKVEAKLEDEKNADLINEIWENLPMTSIQEHAMVTGKSMYCWVSHDQPCEDPVPNENQGHSSGSRLVLPEDG